MARDKVYHLIAGAIVSLVFSLAGNPYSGVFMAAMAGTAKELYDEYSYGGFDVYDLLATIAGGSIISLIIGVIHVIY